MENLFYTIGYRLYLSYTSSLVLNLYYFFLVPSDAEWFPLCETSQKHTLAYIVCVDSRKGPFGSVSFTSSAE